MPSIRLSLAAALATCACAASAASSGTGTPPSGATPPGAVAPAATPTADAPQRDGLARLTAGPLPEPGALEMLAAALGIGVFLVARGRRQG